MEEDTLFFLRKKKKKKKGISKFIYGCFSFSGWVQRSQLCVLSIGRFMDCLCETLLIFCFKSSRFLRFVRLSAKQAGSIEKSPMANGLTLRGNVCFGQHGWACTTGHR